MYWGVFDIAIDMIRADYFGAIEKVRRHVVALTEHGFDGPLWDLRQFLDALILDAPTVAIDAADARHRLTRLLDELASPIAANADPGPVA